jgi:hypothetical protein
LTTYRFTYEGATPSKKNNRQPLVGKNGRAFLPSNFEYKKWLPGAVWEMKLQMSKYTTRFPLQRCKAAYIFIYFPNLRVHDADNVWTTALDMAKKAGIIQDDTWLILGDQGQFPRLRRDRPGWDLYFETFDAAPGPSQVHRNAPPPEAPRS